MAVARRPAKDTPPPKTKPAGTALLKRLRADAEALGSELSDAHRQCKALEKMLGRTKDDSELPAVQSDLQRVTRKFQMLSSALRQKADALKNSIKNIR